MESFRISVAAWGARELENTLREYCAPGRLTQSVPVRTKRIHDPASSDQNRIVSAV